MKDKKTLVLIVVVIVLGLYVFFANTREIEVINVEEKNSNEEEVIKIEIKKDEEVLKVGKEVKNTQDKKVVIIEKQKEFIKIEKQKELIKIEEEIKSIQDKVKYKVTFDVTWSKKTHPKTIPLGSHMSPAVVATHSANGDLFEKETKATDGLEIVAETGNTDLFFKEISKNKNILDSDKGSVMFFVGSTEHILKADIEHNLVSLVSMIAPSPDWFVGIRNVSLVDEKGMWIDKKIVPLSFYDAGTDSGKDFRSEDQDSDDFINNPVDKIFIESESEGIFGNVIIERIKG